MRKHFIYENQFEDLCEYYHNEGYLGAYTENKPKEFPCIVLVEIIFNRHGEDSVDYHYVYESDFKFNLSKSDLEHPRKGLVDINKAREWVKNAFVGPFGEGLANSIADEFVKSMEK